MREKAIVQSLEVFIGVIASPEGARQSQKGIASSLSLLAMTQLLPKAKRLREKLFTLLAFGVLFLLIANKVLAWEEVTLPSQTTVVKEDELLLNGQARKYLHCRSGLTYAEIKDFFARFLPSVGWQVDCTECSKQKVDIALGFTKGENKLDIIFPNIQSEKGKNDFMAVITDIKNEAGLDESVVKEGEDYPGKDIASLPRYPKSQRVASIERVSDKKINLGYQTKDSIDQVLDFYSSNLGEYGWHLVKEINFENINKQVGAFMENQKGLRILEGGALVIENSQARCMITVSEHPKEDIDSRIIGINYEEK